MRRSNEHWRLFVGVQLIRHIHGASVTYGETARVSALLQGVTDANLPLLLFNAVNVECLC